MHKKKYQFFLNEKPSGTYIANDYDSAVEIAGYEPDDFYSFY